MRTVPCIRMKQQMKFLVLSLVILAGYPRRGCAFSAVTLQFHHVHQARQFRTLLVPPPLKASSSSSSQQGHRDEQQPQQQQENRIVSPTNGEIDTDVEQSSRSFSTIRSMDETDLSNIVDRDPLPIHKSIQSPAGLLCDDHDLCAIDDTTNILPHMGRSRKRVLILCTGGTLTMSNDPTQNNSLAPVQGALTAYLASMREFTDDPEMPEIVAHEYAPLIDSSDMGPGDWALIAEDIATNYYHFDGTRCFGPRKVDGLAV